MLPTPSVSTGGGSPRLTPTEIKQAKEAADLRLAEARAAREEARLRREREVDRQARAARRRAEEARREREVLVVEVDPDPPPAPEALSIPVWPYPARFPWTPAGAALAGLLILWLAPILGNVIALAGLLCGDLGAIVWGGAIAGLSWIGAEVLYLRAYLRRQPWEPVLDPQGRPMLAAPGQTQERTTRTVCRGVLYTTRRAVPVPAGAVLARRPLTALRRWIPAGEWVWKDRPPREAAGPGLAANLRDRAAGLLHREDPEAALRHEEREIRIETARLRLERLRGE